MVVRASLWCVLLLAGVVHAEKEYAFGGPWPQPAAPPPPPRYAAGSVVGPWSFQELGGFVGAGTFVDPRLYSDAGFWTTFTAGWGFEVGRVHLRPSARFALGYELTLPDVEGGSRFSWSPLALSLAANNLLDDSVTGLRLTPAVGVTVPTWVSRSTPLTTLSAALQLERRFGPVELALRSEIGKPLYAVFATPPTACFWCPIEAQPNVNWFWDNSLQGEWWMTPSLSLGLSFTLHNAWRFPTDSPVVDANGNLHPAPYVGRSDLTTGRVFFSWAVTRLFGLTLEVNTTQPPLSADGRHVRFPFLSFGTWADNGTLVFLSAWFRTDAALSRNWLER